MFWPSCKQIWCRRCLRVVLEASFSRLRLEKQKQDVIASTRSAALEKTARYVGNILRGTWMRDCLARYVYPVAHLPQSAERCPYLIIRVDDCLHITWCRHCSLTRRCLGVWPSWDWVPSWRPLAPASTQRTPCFFTPGICSGTSRERGLAAKTAARSVSWYTRLLSSMRRVFARQEPTRDGELPSVTLKTKA